MAERLKLEGLQEIADAISCSEIVQKRVEDISAGADIVKENKLAEFATEAEVEAQRIIDSFPEDYTELIDKVDGLNEDLTQLSESVDEISTQKLIDNINGSYNLKKYKIVAGETYYIKNLSNFQITIKTTTDGTDYVDDFGTLPRSGSLTVTAEHSTNYLRGYAQDKASYTICNVKDKLHYVDMSIENVDERTTHLEKNEYDFVSSKNALSSNVDIAITNFASDFIGTDDAESFLFFTDAHTLPHTEDEENFKKSIGNIEYVFNSTPTSFVLCGGDWLTNSDTKVQASKKLGRLDGIMRGKFGNKYYPILGNHDTNYQGEGTLEDATIKNIMFREYGKGYYSFLTPNKTRFYVFDSGTDWTDNMIDYRKEQRNWFGEQLLINDDEHSVIAIHIFTNQTKANLESNPTSTNLCDFLTKIADAYNNKTSITVGFDRRDYANTKGKVSFLICGHTHYDANLTYNNIPIIITKNASYTSDLDLCLIDYKNAKLKMRRVGSGNDREISIIV